VSSPDRQPVVLATFGLGIIAGLRTRGQGAWRVFFIEVCDFDLSQTNTPPNKLEFADLVSSNRQMMHHNNFKKLYMKQ
jgi:hypothetical protein